MTPIWGISILEYLYYYGKSCEVDRRGCGPLSMVSLLDILRGIGKVSCAVFSVATRSQVSLSCGPRGYYATFGQFLLSCSVFELVKVYEPCSQGVGHVSPSNHLEIFSSKPYRIAVRSVTTADSAPSRIRDERLAEDGEGSLRLSPRPNIISHIPASTSLGIRKYSNSLA